MRIAALQKLPFRADQSLPGLALLVALGLAGCAATGPAFAPAPGDIAAVVEARSNLRFEPAQIRIKAGDTVEWRNVSIMGHTVTADPARAKNPDNVRLPSGVEAFHGDLPRGQVYRHTFSRPGTYRYFCIPHEGQGMIGEVVVTG